MYKISYNLLTNRNCVSAVLPAREIETADFFYSFLYLLLK